jgi:hypothetical protein
MAAERDDVLSFGDPERSRPRSVVVALVVAAVVAAYLLGTREAADVGAAASPSDPAEGLVAGGVRQGHPVDGRLSFDVQVRNGTDQELEVAVRTLGDVRLLQPRSPVRVPAHRARTVTVLPPTRCLWGDAGSLGELTVDVGGPDGERPRQVVVPVLDPADLTAYLTALCAGSTMETAAALHGVWVLDEAFAQFVNAEDGLLVWFRPDGTFRADDQGNLFGPDVALHGDYRVRERRLSLVFRGGFVCAPGQRAEWTMHRREPTRLALRYLSGECKPEPGGVWVLQRVLESVPAGVDW